MGGVVVAVRSDQAMTSVTSLFYEHILQTIVLTEIHFNHGLGQFYAAVRPCPFHII